MRRPTHRSRRPGFTLVELMVVIVVLSMLVALLIPAIAGAVKAANAARVTAEINNMATALAQFKTAYSDYPPSRIVLNESPISGNTKGNYDTADTTSLAQAFGDIRSDITLGQLSQRTVRYMSKFFPRALCFSTVGPGVSVDINGDGTAQSGPIYLGGDECLVLFLGGMTTTPTSVQATDIGMSGFSRNPKNPFDRTSTSRTQPLYEFKSDRLVDIDGDGFPSYNDALASGAQGRYYAYFSAYGGNSYDPNDCNLNAKDSIGTNQGDVFSRTFQVNFTVNSGSYNSCFNPPTTVCVSPAPNPYTSTAPISSTGAVTWQNPQTFQIISAGSDRIFGVAGQFAGNNASNKLPIPNSGPLNETVIVNNQPVWYGGVCGNSQPGNQPIDGDRNTEADNLANFTGGRMNQ